MLNKIIQFILIFLFIFTPIAFGSMDLWAFSLMELGILFMIILWTIKRLRDQSSHPSPISNPPSRIIILLLSLFLALVLFQMIPIPSEMIKIISPKTYELRHRLLITNAPLRMIPLSFIPFVTKIEFLKWLILSGLFLSLLHWKFSEDGHRIINSLMVVIFLMGVFEAFYGMFEFFSGHHHILYLKGVNSVTGTFINHNYFAGYLLMIIPLSMGFFFYREAIHTGRFRGWRHRLSSLDGKTLLIGFGLMVMILGLLFSASRMGIMCLLLSFTLIIFLFRDPQRKQKKFSATSALILGMAFLWAVWIGLDAVIRPFFTAPEDFKMRWMIWKSTFQIVKEFLLFGSGLGTFTQVFPMYRAFHIRGLVTHAENDYLQLTSEVGLIGMGILLILFIYLFFKAVSGIRSLSRWGAERYIGVGGLVGILALMFHSVVERNLQVPANAFLYTFIWAIVLRVALDQEMASKFRSQGT
jgi:O-antigen ligase